MSTLQLYTTAGCHLCELAEQMIRTFELSSVYTLEMVEIGDDDQLVERYGTRIPVLRNSHGQELNWPFDETAISEFLGIKAGV